MNRLPVPRDWNFVDDEPEDAQQQASPEESGLDAGRVRLITLERRSADRVRQWRIGCAVMFTVAATILIVRGVEWLVEGRHRQWASIAIVAAALMLLGAWRMRPARR